MLQRLPGYALEFAHILLVQGRSGQGGQVFDQHLAALQQLRLQARELYPGEIAAQHQRQQAGGQQGEQQYTASDAEILEHDLPPYHMPAV